MQEKFIDISIKPDGSIDFDQINYDGKSCSGDIDELINAIGKKVSSQKKKEYFKIQKVKINQRRIT